MRLASSLLVALPLALAAGSAWAQPVSLTFEQAIYQDAKEAPLKSPEGVACSPDGTEVVVADTGNARLLTYAMKDGQLSGGAELKLVQATYPVRVQLDGKRQILVLDGKTRHIVRLDPKGIYSGEVAFKGIAAVPAVIPASFKVDARDGLYVLDAASRRVLVLDATDTVTRQLPLPASGEFTDIAVDVAGTIYAVEAVQAALWAADKSATTFRAVTPGMKDKMSFPGYLVASRGKLLVVDRNGNGIVTLGQDGSYQGRQLSIGWGEGLIYYPGQICVTEAGAVILADRYNNRVQYFSAAK